MTESEKVLCKMYLENLDKTHPCNKILADMLEKEPVVSKNPNADNFAAKLITIVRNMGFLLNADDYNKITAVFERAAKREKYLCHTCQYRSQDGCAYEDIAETISTELPPCRIFQR